MWIQSMTQWSQACGVVVLGLFLLPGCSTDPKRSVSAVSPEVSSAGINEINLLAIPVALNLDQLPGVDGFVIKIYAGSRRHPKPVPIENGKLEVLMFDGMPGSMPNANPTPRRTWTYSIQELKAAEIHSSIGTGYQLAPLWGDQAPESPKITVVVRYTSDKGVVLVSAPSVIAVALK